VTDRAALLAAIREAPSDDTPRLIWADWHEDGGRALYAEFVRAQVEMARLPQARALDLRWRPESKVGHLIRFRTKRRVEAGEEVDVHYDSGRTLTIEVLTASPRILEVEGRVIKDGLKSSRDRVRRRELRERTRQLWREGEVVREAVPEQLDVTDVGLEYRPGLRAIVSRGLVSTLGVIILDDDLWVREVCRLHPVTRIVLTGAWDSVEERVEAGYLPDDVLLDARWECRDGRRTFVSEMGDGHLLNAVAMCERTPGWRVGAAYVLRREAERRELLSSPRAEESQR